MAATYVHRPMMIAVYLTNDKITDACCDLKDTNGSTQKIWEGNPGITVEIF